MFIFEKPTVQSSFALRGAGNSISFDDLIGLYQKFMKFSYQGYEGVGFCKEILLSDDPALFIYSVEYEKKFRSLMLRDFDYIELIDL